MISARYPSHDGSKIIDREWPGGDGTVNAYPFGLIIHEGRLHLSWCWRDTPAPNTCHDLCYAYSDDDGTSWKNSDGKIVSKRGETFITADTPGISVWPVPAGKRYINGGSMTVDASGQVHVLVRGEGGKPAHFKRDPETTKWTRTRAHALGSFVQSKGDTQLVLTDGVLYQLPSNGGTQGDQARDDHSSCGI